MPILDAAHNGRPDPQDKLNPPLGKCACGCGVDIFPDDEDIFLLDGYLFAEKDCILSYVGARRVMFRWS